MANFDLFKEFVFKVLGRPIESTRPTHLSGWQVVEALWPLNEAFRPHIAQIRALPYDAAFEPEADDVIEDWAMRLTLSTGQRVSSGAWRVLLERQQQAILVALANERAGNRLLPVPEDLPESAHTGAALLFLLHGMKLPYAVEDRSGMTLPAGTPQASLTRH